MNHTAFGLNEDIKNNNALKIFGETFQLENSFAKQFDSQWRLDGYVSENQIEHIRVYRNPDDAGDESGQWETLSYDDEEAPLELLMLQDDM